MGDSASVQEKEFTPFLRVLARNSPRVVLFHSLVDRKGGKALLIPPQPGVQTIE